MGMTQCAHARAEYRTMAAIDIDVVMLATTIFRSALECVVPTSVLSHRRTAQITSGPGRNSSKCAIE
jgi:hypothetical protein